MLSLAPAELSTAMIASCLLGALVAWAVRGAFEQALRAETAERQRHFKAERDADPLFQAQHSPKIPPRRLQSWAKQIRTEDERRLYVRPDRRRGLTMENRP